MSDEITTLDTNDEGLSDGVSKYKSRNFCVLLYPDNEAHSKAMDYIRSTFRYASCLHECDAKPGGELKKAHWHVVVKFVSPRWNTAVAEELGIEARWLQAAKNTEKCLRYLVHADNPEKYQYSIEDVEGDLKPVLQKSLLDLVEDERMIELMDLLDSIQGRVSYSVFVRMVCAKGLYSDFRRSAVVWANLIREHNSMFTSDYTEV